METEVEKEVKLTSNLLGVGFEGVNIERTQH